MSKYPIAVDTVSQPVLETFNGDPFYVTGIDYNSSVQTSGTLLLSQVIDIEQYTTRHKTVYQNNYETTITTKHEHIKFRVFKSDTEYADVIFSMPVDNASNLNIGDFVRVLYVDDFNLLWEHSSCNSCFVIYNINEDTESLPHTAPLTEPNWSDKTNMVSSQDKFTYKSKAKHDRKTYICLFSVIITILLGIAVGTFMADASTPIPYASAGIALLLIACMVLYTVVCNNRIKEEDEALQLGDLCIARVIEVNKHIKNDSTVFVDVYTKTETVRLVLITSNTKLPNVLRGDYIRLKYLSSSKYVVEGDLANGIFYRYRLDKAHESLRFE